MQLHTFLLPLLQRSQQETVLNYALCNNSQKYQWPHTTQIQYLGQVDLVRSCCALKIWKSFFSWGRRTTNLKRASMVIGSCVSKFL